MKVILFCKDYVKTDSKGDINSDIFINKYLAFLHLFFNSNDINYEIYSRDTVIELNDIPLLIQNEIDSVLASNLMNTYPPDVVFSLIRKDLISGYLKPYGFEEIPSKLVIDLNEINTNEFIIKPRISQEWASIVDPDYNFYFKNYNDKANFLTKNPESKTNFVLQPFIPGPINGVSGVVNSKGEIYFTRSFSFSFNFTNINQLHKAQRAESVIRDFNMFPELEVKVSNFLRDKNIKNAQFSLKCILNDNKHYAMDWNFKISPPLIMAQIMYNENECVKWLSSLIGLDNNLPDVFQNNNVKGQLWQNFMRYY